MSEKIKKIDFIKNMAVFKDFRWDSAVRDKSNNIAEFKNINILYGRNYSGKTTLSRIFRALETGVISDKYSSPEFQLSFGSNIKIKQDSLKGHNKVIRVFNRDFVKDNLPFIHDEQQEIKSFAILGKNNTVIEEKIAQHEAEIGSRDNKTGLLGKFVEAEDNFSSTKESHDAKSTELENNLRDKANNRDTGIKHNKIFGDANYNIATLKTDISAVTKKDYAKLNDDQVTKFDNTVKEETKVMIVESKPFDLKYPEIILKAKELIEKKIQPSAPIQELLEDAVLAEWVRTGRTQHEGKRSKCAFCGGSLSADLWEKLDKHFNLESEELRKSLADLLSSIDNEKKRIPNLLKINKAYFYSKFTRRLDWLNNGFAARSDAYIQDLEFIERQIKKRKDAIFTSLQFDESVDQSISAADKLKKVREVYEKFRNKSDEFTQSLEKEQSAAREKLRLHEVYKFITDIGYVDNFKAIEELKAKMNAAETSKIQAEKDVQDKQTVIDKLKSQLKDESKGAEKINDYLNKYFEYLHLSLKPIIENPEGASPIIYKFKIIRDKKEAFHLSEGEGSLIAFCYFMAKLEDIETNGKKPIIWIDDPVSSLDSNHIFFIYSFIRAVIVEQKNFSQLFISTHNLEFLGYLKRIDRDKKYFLLERSDDLSHIHLMPEYLKEYITEFNYLFHQIFKCAADEKTEDENYHVHYNFGNNARKFLEMYLYYKFPDGIKDKENKKLKNFFDGENNIPSFFVDRINNEGSHLSGKFERGAMPVYSSPEARKAAKLILNKIYDKDKDQYLALFKSIGVENEAEAIKVIKKETQ